MRQQLQRARGSLQGALVAILLGAFLISTAARADAAGVYRIEAAIDPERYVLRGTAHLTLVNDTNLPLETLLLDYAGEAIEGSTRLAAKTGDGKALNLIPTDGRDSTAALQFLVKLPRKVHQGEAAELRFEFSQAWPHEPLRPDDRYA